MGLPKWSDIIRMYVMMYIIIIMSIMSEVYFKRNLLLSNNDH